MIITALTHRAHDYPDHTLKKPPPSQLSWLAHIGQISEIDSQALVDFGGSIRPIGTGENGSVFALQCVIILAAHIVDKGFRSSAVLPKADDFNDPENRFLCLVGATRM